jgi:hypothetical protein
MGDDDNSEERKRALARAKSALDAIVESGTGNSKPYRNSSEEQQEAQANDRFGELVQSLAELDEQGVERLSGAIDKHRQAMTVVGREEKELIAQTICHDAIDAMYTAERDQLDEAKNWFASFRPEPKVEPMLFSKERIAFYNSIAEEAENAETVEDIKRLALELILYDDEKMTDKRKQKFIAKYSQKSAKRIEFAIKYTKMNAGRVVLENVVGTFGTVVKEVGYTLFPPTALRRAEELDSRLRTATTFSSACFQIYLIFTGHAIPFILPWAGSAIYECVRPFSRKGKALRAKKLAEKERQREIKAFYEGSRQLEPGTLTGRGRLPKAKDKGYE